MKKLLIVAAMLLATCSPIASFAQALITQTVTASPVPGGEAFWTDANAPIQVRIINPWHHYFVLLDSNGIAQTDLANLTSGSYTLITSAFGFATKTTTVNVGPDGLKTLEIPTLAPVETSPYLTGIELPEVSNYLFIILNPNDHLVEDVSLQAPGEYSIYSFRDGKLGPVAFKYGFEKDIIKHPRFAGYPALTPPTFKRWQASEALSDATTTEPAIIVKPVTTTESATPAPSGPKMCYVNGYTTKKGTVVAGYYRRC